MKRLLLCVLLAGCANMYPEPDHTARELEATRQQLAQNEEALTGALVDTRPIDCTRATQLGDNVCSLAERICALVERLPRTNENTAACLDARARCATARQRVKASCPK